MRIRAIRVAELGRFSAPVALENLSGSLDVLAGPNELGKSTLLAALRLAFFEKHTGNSQRIEDLRPYAGGAPRVEVEFDVGGRRLRIAKRFLAARSAELTDLGTGATLRGADAESELARMLRLDNGKSPFGLLWIGQGAVTETYKDDTAGLDVLRSAIESEINAVGLGSNVCRLQARVRAALSEILTDHAPKRRRKGRYEEASRLRDRLASEHAKAQSRLTEARAKLDRLAVLRMREAELAHPVAVAQRLEARAKAEEALAAAREALARSASATLALRGAESELGRTREALAVFERSLAEASALLVSEHADAGGLPALMAEVAAAEASVAERTATMQAMRTQLTGAELALRHAIDAERRSDLDRQLAELTQREARAREASERSAELRAAVAACRATDTLVASARKEAAAIKEIEVRLAAAAPTIVVNYAADHAPRIRVDGRVLADGQALSAAAPVVLDVPGVGTIQVVPGRIVENAETRAGLERHRQRLQALLVDAGGDVLAEIELRLDERRAAEGRLAEGAARLAVLAPQGLAHLAQERQTLAELAHALPELPVDAPSRAAAEAAVARLRGLLVTAERELEPQRKKLAELAEKQVRNAARSEERRQRLAAIEAGLPPAQERPVARERMQGALATAETSVNAAVRERTAWLEQAPDPSRLRTLEDALAAAQEALARNERERADVRNEAARLEGELAALRDDDIEMRALGLAEARAAAEASFTRFADEAAALHLLHTELAAEETRTRDRFLAPVNERLAPYLSMVFPESRAAFGPGLDLEELARGELRERISRLSDGTREQIAVLVRLSFARLLADDGRPTPVIIDDALVYADDERIGSMFRALGQAAQTHQVIVLTCRTRAFEGLGGARLKLTPWRAA